MNGKIIGYPSRLHPLGISGQEDQEAAIKVRLIRDLLSKTTTCDSKESSVICTGPHEHRGFCPHGKDVTYSITCAYIPRYLGRSLDPDAISAIVQLLLLRGVSPKDYAKDLAAVLCVRHMEKDLPGIETEGSRVQVSYFCECKTCCNGGFAREIVDNTMPGRHRKFLENSIDQYLYQRLRSKEPSPYDPTIEDN